mmetsp:Transcript_47185/g.117712  ORF Transcript_47185/g.117712 Transcript_47185/m.117712 type:complete len:263 (-) Transcript_47185:1482-2270(-)
MSCSRSPTNPSLGTMRSWPKVPTSSRTSLLGRRRRWTRSSKTRRRPLCMTPPKTGRSVPTAFRARRTCWSTTTSGRPRAARRRQRHRGDSSCRHSSKEMRISRRQRSWTSSRRAHSSRTPSPPTSTPKKRWPNSTNRGAGRRRRMHAARLTGRSCWERARRRTETRARGMPAAGRRRPRGWRPNGPILLQRWHRRSGSSIRVVEQQRARRPQRMRTIACCTSSSRDSGGSHLLSRRERRNLTRILRMATVSAGAGRRSTSGR